MQQLKTGICLRAVSTSNEQEWDSGNHKWLTGGCRVLANNHGADEEWRYLFEVSETS